MTHAQPLEARTVIYVHGIGNKPMPSILKCQWDHALFGYDVGERSRLAYWVNREFYPDPVVATCASGDVTQLEDQPTGRGISVRRHMEAVSLEEEVQAVTTKKTDQATLLRIAKAVEASTPDGTSAGLAAAEVRARIIPLPRPVREWITRRLVRALLRDVNDYFYVDARREQMRESVLERLRVGNGPFVVIGHSQGSMIAYDVLSQLPEDLRDEVRVPLFLTVGSPLGIQEVQDRIKRLTGQKRLGVPSCVERWLNVADALDPVALDPTLAGEFTPSSRVQDLLVANPDGPRHPHSGSGYLRTQPVRDAVRRAVKTDLFQAVSSFVIARDLTRELEDKPREQRHPVLIQLADPTAHKRPVDEMRRTVVTALKAIAQRGSISETELLIDELQYYVAATLTREEAEQLAAEAQARIPSLSRVWRNAAKRALLETSINTVQAGAAHIAYRALGRGIEWAILDSGIAAHPHFVKHQNIVAQYDCTVGGALAPGGVALDEHGHGTHVAGIIAGVNEMPAANGEPARTVSGMAPEAKLHIYKVLDRDGGGQDSWIIKALDHIADTNARAGRLAIHGVNLSLGGPFDQSVYGVGHSPLCNELRRLWRQGVLVVLAAGNEGFAVLQTQDGLLDANMDLSIGDPANLEEALAVGSVHKENPHTYGVSYFSSRGPTADGRQKPDLVAPGERILSCRHNARPGALRAEDLYVEMSGTSMAAPHVSGILAAFLSVHREFIGYSDRVKEILLANCTDLRRDRPQQGAGLPNLVRMLVST